MNVSVTGASGFIGSRLREALASEGHAVHTIKLRQMQELPPCDAIVHLAGESVAQKWTPEVKRRIRESRVDGTRRLVEAISRMASRPAVLISASATGYYGSREDEILTESSPPGQGFLAEVCVDWEKEAQAAETLGLRVVVLRTGIVLGRGGGALARMLPIFRLFLGGQLGSGRQWMPWIHIDDATGLIRFAVDHPGLTGPMNVCAPNPVRNSDFTNALAAALHRPAPWTVPAFMLAALYGEMGGALLESQRAVPRVALTAGYRFRYADLEPALRSLV
jgi:uncharacterized protein (TIGR01777 family)